MGAKPASASVVLLLGVTPDPFLWVQGKKANGLSSALSIVSSKKKKKKGSFCMFSVVQNRLWEGIEFVSKMDMCVIGSLELLRSSTQHAACGNRETCMRENVMLTNGQAQLETSFQKACGSFSLYH